MKFHLMSPAICRVGLFGEVLVERSLVVALDRHLGIHGKGHVVLAGAEGLDLFVGAGFLLAEVVGREADDDEALVFVFLVRGFQAGCIAG